eukprot:6257391-Amphidinium_carterae.2
MCHAAQVGIQPSLYHPRFMTPAKRATAVQVAVDSCGLAAWSFFDFRLIKSMWPGCEAPRCRCVAF